MRLFGDLVFDRVVDQNGGAGFPLWAAPFAWDPILGAVETLSFFVVASNVKGTAQLYIDLYEQNELIEDINVVKNLFNNVSLSNTDKTILRASYSMQDTLWPATTRLFTLIVFNGSADAQAWLRIWVTGRGTSLQSPASLR